MAKRSIARRWLIFVLVMGLLGGACYGLFRVLQYTDFSERRREGPPALVEANKAHQLWVVVKYEERLNVGLRGRGERVHTRYHLALQSHDINTGRKLWSRQLRSVSEHDDGHGARARILGQVGDIVWLFIGDQPVAVSAADGSVRATGIDIVASNPALQKLFPTQLDFYSFDSGPVLVLADARRIRITLPGYAAVPYVPASEDEFSQRRFMASRWNGGYEMRDFMTPHGRPGSRWLGLLTAEEAREAGKDEYGSNLADPRRSWQPGADVRRSFWTARITRTRQFSEGSHERLSDVVPLPQSPSWLRAGLLVQAGTKLPLLLGDTDVLVLHRTRIDAQGRAALARVRIGDDNSVQTAWTTELPFDELGNRWQLPVPTAAELPLATAAELPLPTTAQRRVAPQRLLMVGYAQIGRPGDSAVHEFVSVVELQGGAQQGWNLTTDQAWTPP